MEQNIKYVTWNLKMFNELNMSATFKEQLIFTPAILLKHEV